MGSRHEIVEEADIYRGAGGGGQEGRRELGSSQQLCLAGSTDVPATLDLFSDGIEQSRAFCHHDVVYLRGMLFGASTSHPLAIVAVLGRD